MQQPRPSKHNRIRLWQATPSSSLSSEFGYTNRVAERIWRLDVSKIGNSSTSMIELLG
jgi:hypothetical protein